MTVRTTSDKNKISVVAVTNRAYAIQWQTCKKGDVGSYYYFAGTRNIVAASRGEKRLVTNLEMCCLILFSKRWKVQSFY